MKKRICSLLLALVILAYPIFSVLASGESGVLPTASIKMVPGTEFDTTPIYNEIQNAFDYDPDYSIGATISGVDAGVNFDDWNIDLQLVTDKPIRAKLIGRYTGTYGGTTTTYDWQGTEEYIDIPAGTVNIVKEMIGNIPVSQLINANVEEFYCALLVDKTSFDGTVGIEMNLVIKDPADESVTLTPTLTAQSDDVDMTFVADALPTASIKMVPGTEFDTTPIYNEIQNAFDYDPDYSIGATISGVDAGINFDDWNIDLQLVTDKPIRAKLIGRYTGTYGGTTTTYDWQGTEEYIDIPAGTVNIVKEMIGNIPVSQLINANVEEFYCALLVDKTSFDGSVNIAMNLVIKNPDNENITLAPTLTPMSDDVDMTFVADALPTASITMVSGTEFDITPIYNEIQNAFDYDPDYSIGATISGVDAGINFDDWNIDLQLVTDKPIRAKLIGRYTGTYGGTTTTYDWQGTEEYIDIPAGTVNIVKEMIGNIPVSQLINANVEEFYCALLVDKTSLDGSVNIAMNLVIKNPDNENITLAPTLTPMSDDVDVTFDARVPAISSVKKTGADIKTDAVLSTLPAPYNSTYTLGGTVAVSDIGAGYSDWSLGVEVSFAGDDYVYAKILGKASGANWTQRVKFKNYYDEDSTRVIFTRNLNLISSSVPGYQYSYAIIIDRDEHTLNGIDVTAQTYLFSPDGDKIPLGEPLTVNMRDERPISSLTKINAKDFPSTPVFSDLAEYAGRAAIGASFTMVDPGMGYDDYYADFTLTVTGGSVKARLLGNYGDHGWVDLGEMLFEESVPYQLVNLPQYTTVKYLYENVSTFRCVLVVNETSVLQNINVELSLKLYEPEGTLNPSNPVQIGNTITNIFTRRLLDIVEADKTARLVFSGDTPTTLSNAVKIQGPVPIGGSVTFVGTDGVTVLGDEDRVVTGNIMRIQNGAVVTQYALVIYGDVNCDGNADKKDVDAATDSYVNGGTLTGAALAAGDVNGDTVIDAADIFCLSLKGNGNIGDDEFIDFWN